MPTKKSIFATFIFFRIIFAYNDFGMFTAKKRAIFQTRVQKDEKWRNIFHVGSLSREIFWSER